MTSDATSSPSHTARPVRVLVADDVEDVRRLVRLGLVRAGNYEVVAEAGDGAQAISLTREHRPDVLVLDIAMPELDGFEVLARVTDEAPETRVVMLSGFGAERYQQRAMDLGAVAYIEKSGGLIAISEVLDEVCADLRTASDDRESERGHDSGHGSSTDHEIVSYMLHEVATPVAIIRGYASHLLESDLRDEELVRTNVETIFRNAEDLSTLLHRLRQARDIEIGEIELDQRQIELGSLVRQTVEDLTHVISPHPVNVRADETIEVTVDPPRIRQILANLIGNAAKYSPEEAPVGIAVTAGGQHAKVSVSDRGEGIAPEHRERVFDKFTRFDRSAKGSGLGLYIARGIAHAHGGDLVVEDGPEDGCTFTLELPLS